MLSTAQFQSAGGSNTELGHCPYSVDDEPTMEWTVEHFLLWLMLKSNQTADIITARAIRALHEVKAEVIAPLEQHQQQQQQQQKPLMETKREEMDIPIVMKQKVTSTNNNNLRQDAASTTSNNNNKNNDSSTNNIPANEAAVAASAAKSNASTNASNHSSSTTPFALQVEVTACVPAPSLVGRVYSLVPKPRGPCLIGRSRAQRIRERGICLDVDTEVSSNHGKFEMVKDAKTGQHHYYYIDTESTNGSYLLTNSNNNDKSDSGSLEPNKPLLLEDGMMLQVGMTQLKIHLGSGDNVVVVSKEPQQPLKQRRGGK